MHSQSLARGWWLAATIAVAVSVVTVVVAVADGKDDVAVRAASPGAIGAAADGVSSSTTVTEVTTTLPETTTTTTTTLVVPEPLRFSGSSGTLSFDAAVTTVPALSGTFTRFEVDVRDSAGGMISVGILYGDGGPQVSPGPPIPECQGAPDSGEPSSHKVVRDRAYRLPGVYTVTVIANSGRCKSSSTAEASGELTVGPGTVVSNGPREPKVNLYVPSEGAGDREGTTYLGIGYSDGDGWVRSLSVDWGDGADPEVLEYPDCRDPVTRFPGTGNTVEIPHRYATGGTFDVTVTAVSTGCDGLHEQRASSSITLQSRT